MLCNLRFLVRSEDAGRFRVIVHGRQAPRNPPEAASPAQLSRMAETFQPVSSGCARL